MEAPQEIIPVVRDHPPTPKRQNAVRTIRRQRRTTGLETPVTHLTRPSVKPRQLFPRNLMKSMSDAALLTSNPETAECESAQETCYRVWSEGENGSKAQKTNEDKSVRDSTCNTDQPASYGGNTKHSDGSREVPPKCGNVPVHFDESKDGDENWKAPETPFGPWQPNWNNIGIQQHRNSGNYGRNEHGGLSRRLQVGAGRPRNLGQMLDFYDDGPRCPDLRRSRVNSYLWGWEHAPIPQNRFSLKKLPPLEMKVDEFANMIENTFTDSWILQMQIIVYEPPRCSHDKSNDQPNHTHQMSASVAVDVQPASQSGTIQAVDPQAETVQAADPQAETVQAADPQAETVQAADPQAETVQAADPQAETVQAADPQAETVQAADPQAETVQAADPQAETVQAADPQAETVQAADPQAETVQAADPQAEIVQLAAPKVETVQSVQSAATQAEAVQSVQSADPQADSVQSVRSSATQAEAVQSEDQQVEAIQTADSQTEAVKTGDPQTEAVQAAAPQTEDVQTADPQTEAVQSAASQTKAVQSASLQASQAEILISNFCSVHSFPDICNSVTLFAQEPRSELPPRDTLRSECSAH